MAYRILRGCSTRVRPYVLDQKTGAYVPEIDPKTGEPYAEHEQFLEFRPGDVVETVPKHVPVKEWTDSGVMEKVTA